MHHLYESIEKLVDERTPEIVYVEDFFVSSRATRGVNLNLYLRGAIAMLLSRRKIKYKFLSPSEWKSYVTGSRSGKPTKSEKSALGKNANKTIITEKLAERYGITFPEKIHISGKLRKFKYDISDAVGILLCGIHSETSRAFSERVRIFFWNQNMLMNPPRRQYTRGLSAADKRMHSKHERTKRSLQIWKPNQKSSNSQELQASKITVGAKICKRLWNFSSR